MTNLNEIKTGMTESAKAIDENFKTLEETLSDNSLNVLSSGLWYMNAQTTIKPSKRISECKTGWILQWQPTNDGATKINSNFYYTHVPKAIIMPEGGGGSGTSIIVPLFSGVGQITESITKAVYISDTGITGHANNSLSTDAGGKGTRHWVMTAVYEY